MHVISDSWTAAVYFAAPLVIAASLLCRRNAITRCVAVVIVTALLACGLTHIIVFLQSGEPMQSLQAAIELMAAAIAVTTTILFWTKTPAIGARPRSANLAEENRLLKSEVERRVMNEDFMRSAYAQLEQQVETATKALGLAYAKLNANRQRLAFALDGANDGLWDWKLREKSIYFSARFAAMLGYEPREKTISVERRWALIHQDDRATALKAFEAHLEGKAELYESKHRLRTRHGDHIWVLDRGKVVERDHLGHAVRAVGTSTDISRQKAAEHALQASNQRVKRLYEQTPALLYSVDTEGKLLSVTDHWLDAMGYSMDEVIGKRSVSFMTEDSRRRIAEEALPAFREHGRVRDVPCRMVRKSGEIFDALLSATSEQDQSGEVIRSLAVLVDVTERNRALRQLEESESRLRLALEGAREGLWDWNVATGELFLSPQAETILGFPPNEPPNNIDFWQTLLPADDKGQFSAGLHDLGFGKIPSLVCEQELCPPGKARIWVEWRASSVLPKPGLPGRRVVGIFRDITARKRAELQTAYRALHDSLTGLPNRMAFEEQLQRVHAEAELTGRQLAVMFLDLDRFKAVNDSFGHDCGDRLLVEVGRRLQRCLRKSDLVARYGGDEFAILARDYKKPSDIDRLASRIIKAVGKPIAIEEQDAVIGMSIGITSFPEDRSPAEGLVANADLALYRAKQTGRKTWQRYHPGLPSRRGSKPSSSDAALYDALRGGEFEVLYQPVVRTDDLSLHALEATISWNHPVRKRQMATVFVPELLNSPFLRFLVEWSLQSAAEQFAAWRDLGLAADVSLSIDMPTPLLHAQNLPDTIERIITQIGLPPSILTLELTEDALSEDIFSRGVIQALSQKGVGLAIDDFGTGSSALQRLSGLQVDQLKIHGDFIASMADQDGNQALVKAIIAVADSLGMAAVAKDIDTADQLAATTDMGCRYVQGSLFAAPADANSASHWLNRWQDRCRHDRELDLLRHG